MKYREKPVYAVQYIKQSENIKECFNSYPLWLDNALKGNLGTVNKLTCHVVSDATISWLKFEMDDAERNQCYHDEDIELTDWIIYTTYKDDDGLFDIHVCRDEEFKRRYEAVKE